MSTFFTAFNPAVVAVVGIAAQSLALALATTAVSAVRAGREPAH